MSESSSVMCRACFDELDPDMWTCEEHWAALKPVIPYDKLPICGEDDYETTHWKAETYAAFSPHVCTPPRQAQSDLHVFLHANVYTVATSAEDAADLHHEGNLTEVRADMFRQLDDASEVELWCDANGDPEVPERGSVRVTKTCAEWSEHGRGYLFGSCL